MIGIEYTIVKGSINRIKRQLPARINAATRDSCSRITNMVYRQFKKEVIGRGHIVDGTLLKETRIVKLNGTHYNIVTPSYLIPLEKGSRPHAIPWMERQRGAGTQYFGKDNAKNLFWIIKNKGTKPHPFTSEMFDRELPMILKSVEKTFITELMKIK